jgi:hypothetical protein
MDMDMHPSPDKMDIPSSTPSTLAYLLDLPIMVGLEDGLDVVGLPVGFPVGCLLFFVGFFFVGFFVGDAVLQKTSSWGTFWQTFVLIQP